MSDAKPKENRRGTCQCWDRITNRINSAIENFFAWLGNNIAKCPHVVLLLVVCAFGVCCIGYTEISFVTDIYDLWRPLDSPVWAEQEFIDDYWTEKDYGLMVISAVAKGNDKSVNLLHTDYLDEWWDIHLEFKTVLPSYTYTYTDDGGVDHDLELNYFADGFEEPDELTTLFQYGLGGLTVAGYSADVIPLCRLFANSPLEAQFQLPCYFLSLFDCFAEGAYFFPYSEYLGKTYFTELLPLNPYTYKPSYQALNQLELGAVFAPSCKVWSQTVVPSNFLYGGEVRTNDSDDTSMITEMHAFQTIASLDSPFSVARKLKIARGECAYTTTYAIECADITNDEIDEADEILLDWLELYIEFMEDYAIAHNKKKNDNLLEIQFWTPRSTRDLLAAASSADFGLLAAAYVAMIVFASLTAMRPSNGFLSKSEASFGGVLLVLFANVATLGISSWIMDLSPNVVQVLPFIALGFGVDDMFVFLFSFKFTHRKEGTKPLRVQALISEMSRKAGSSVALTSLANFLAFMIGSTMSLPDVQKFGITGMLIVVLNFIAVIFGFTAIMTLVAMRMDGRYKDWAWICCFSSQAQAEKKMYEEQNADTASILDPLFDWMTKTYTRVVIILVDIALVCVAVYGMTLMKPGLPLADIVPDNHYGFEFLTVREQYFHSYTVYLYTDAKLSKLKHIDWENEFENWIDETNEIYSISDLVYSTPDTHKFWAWDMQEYLQAQYVGTFEPYKVGATFSLDETINYIAKVCESDRLELCSKDDVYYVEGSSLYYCLEENYHLLTTRCQGYIDQITSDSVYPMAEQIYLQDYTGNGYNVTGLYVRPASSDVQVFWKYPNSDGFIYQSDCGDSYCEWYVLDADLVPVYTGLSTTVGDVQPAYSGWTDYTSGEPVAVFHLYYDFILDYLGYDRPDVFIDTPVTAASSFSFRADYSASDTEQNDLACFQTDYLRLLMNDYDTFSDITLTIDDQSVSCPAIADSSMLCNSFSNFTNVGDVECGSKEANEKETYFEVSEWYASNCTEGWTIMAIDEDLDDLVMEELFQIGCDCDSPSNWSAAVTDEMFFNNASAMFFSPCASKHDNNFGGVGYSNKTSDGVCGSKDHTMSLECNAYGACDSLEVCFPDYAARDCAKVDIQSFIDNVIDGASEARAATSIVSCLWEDFDTLSECCQTAITDIMLSPDSTSDGKRTFPCMYHGEFSNLSPADEFDANLEDICNVDERCEYTNNTAPASNSSDCYTWCYENVEADCQYVSDLYNCINESLPYQARQDYYWECISNNSNSDRTGCCGSAISANSEYASCSLHKSSYNYNTMKYDYGDCNSSNFTEFFEYPNISTVCGTEFNDTTVQLECLQDNVDDLVAGCCREQVLSTINTYNYAGECSSEAMTILKVAAGYSTISNEYIRGLVGAYYYTVPFLFTTNCVDSLLNYCSDDDGQGWPATAFGETASLPCIDGEYGNQTRFCNKSAYTGASMWDDADKSQCRNVTCDAGFYLGVYWPVTQGGYMAKKQGAGEHSDELIANAACVNTADCPVTCDDNSLYDWFSRRKCTEGTIDADWEEPTTDCRPIYETWTVTYNRTTCDLYSNLFDFYGVNDDVANLIAVLPAYYVGYSSVTNYGFKLFAQLYCELMLDKCAAITYDAEVNYAYFFDWCPVTNESELHSTVDTFYTNVYNYVSFTYYDGFVAMCQSSDATYSYVYSTVCNSNVTCCAQYFVGAYTEEATGASSADIFWTYGVSPVVGDFAYKWTDVAPLDLLEMAAQVCHVNSAEEVNTTDAWNANGIPHPNCFNNTLWAYFIDPVGGVLYQDRIDFQNASAVYDPTAWDRVQIKSTFNQVSVRGVDDDQVAVEVILALRKRLKQWKKKKLYVIPGGLLIRLFSQYIGVEQDLAENLAYVSIAVVLAGLLFLLNPIAVCVAVLCNVAMVVEVYGFCDWLGLRINAVLVLNMVIAIGLTMEFTAHMARAFVLSTADNLDQKVGLPFANEGQIRLKKTLREMFTPVSLGALTTLLGVAPISAAEFPYFRQYYFTLYVMIVFFGWLNGVIFQPVILSLYPPAPFIAPTSFINLMNDGPEDAEEAEEALIGDEPETTPATDTDKAGEPAAAVDTPQGEAVDTPQEQEQQPVVVNVQMVQKEVVVSADGKAAVKSTVANIVVVAQPVDEASPNYDDQKEDQEDQEDQEEPQRVVDLPADLSPRDANAAP